MISCQFVKMTANHRKEFSSQICMSICIEKSSFLYNEVDEENRSHIFAFLHYRMDPIATGFKYLVYRLKPLGYRINNWRWIISMFESRISNWTYRLLSLGGRVILIRSVLTGLSIYWCALGHIPLSILSSF